MGSDGFSWEKCDTIFFGSGPANIFTVGLDFSMREPQPIAGDKK